MVPRETVSLFPKSPDVSRDKFEGNMKTLGKQNLLVSRGTIHKVLCYIFRLPLKKLYGKNVLLYLVHGLQLQNCITVGMHLNLVGHMTRNQPTTVLILLSDSLGTQQNELYSM